MKAYFHKNGCTTEEIIYESLKVHAQDIYGYTITELVEEADIIIYRSCIGIDYWTYDISNHDYLRELMEKRKEGATIIIGGCLSKLHDYEANEYFKMNLNRNKIICCNSADWYPEVLNLLATLIHSPEPLYAPLNYGITIAGDGYLAIQRGCSNNCTYCEVNIADYPSISDSYSEILETFEHFLNRGLILLNSMVNLFHNTKMENIRLAL